MMSDFNVGDQSTPYGIVTRVLGDAWREGGFGPGGTFPGADSPGSSRPRVFGLLRLSQQYPGLARTRVLLDACPL